MNNLRTDSYSLVNCRSSTFSLTQKDSICCWVFMSLFSNEHYHNSIHFHYLLQSKHQSFARDHRMSWEITILFISILFIYLCANVLSSLNERVYDRWQNIWMVMTLVMTLFIYVVVWNCVQPQNELCDNGWSHGNRIMMILRCPTVRFNSMRYMKARVHMKYAFQ